MFQVRLSSIIVFILACILFSCSTTQQEKQIDFSDESYSWIENDDFIPPKEVSFTEVEDKFESDYDSLSSESISRLPVKKLDDYFDSDDPTAGFLSLCYARQFSKAKKLSQKIYRKYKSHPAYWNNLGSCYYIQGQYKKALLYYNKSRDLNKNYAPPINNLGVLYQSYGQDQKALAAYQEAFNKRKGSLTPLFNLATLYLKYGLVSKSENLFSALHKRNDEDIDVIHALGTIYLLKGQFKQAVNILEDLDDHLEKSTYGLNYIVALYNYKGSKAAQKYFADIKDSNKNNELYYNKVKSYIGL